MRICYPCGSAKTRIWPAYKNKNPREAWYVNHDPDNNFICFDCYVKYFVNLEKRRRWQKKGNIWMMIKRGKRRLSFKNKDIILPENPRTGICSNCGAVDRRTNLHHAEYDESDPLAHTIELCLSCHMKESWRLGQLKSCQHGASVQLHR